MMIDIESYKEIVKECGGARPYSIACDNWFVAFSHRAYIYACFTVNDGYEAPERLYMDMEVAYRVRNTLNIIQLRESK